MTAPVPIITQGATMTITDGSASPVSIGGISTITGFGGGKASEIDVTTFASTAKEYLMGLQDFGSFEIEGVWNQDDVGQAQCMSAMNLQAQRVFVLTLPLSTANVGTVSVFVMSVNMDGKQNDAARVKISFRTTGKIVWS